MLAQYFSTNQLSEERWRLGDGKTTEFFSWASAVQNIRFLYLFLKWNNLQLSYYYLFIYFHLMNVRNDSTSDLLCFCKISLLWSLNLISWFVCFYVIVKDNQLLRDIWMLTAFKLLYNLIVNTLTGAAVLFLSASLIRSEVSFSFLPPGGPLWYSRSLCG